FFFFFLSLPQLFDLQQIIYKTFFLRQVGFSLFVVDFLPIALLFFQKRRLFFSFLGVWHADKKNAPLFAGSV
ncbi:MAG: hypothetical protein J6W45_02405, partial [Bacteroidales bacterium]|nr:hypothetical protein [Bacteroidales bacterium]